MTGPRKFTVYKGGGNRTKIRWYQTGSLAKVADVMESYYKSGHAIRGLLAGLQRLAGR